MTTAIEHLLDVVQRNEGALVLSFGGVMWAVAAEFGRETEDSPVVGGAAYGMGGTWADALEQAASQCGWAVPERMVVTYDDTGNESSRWPVPQVVESLAQLPAGSSIAADQAALVVSIHRRGEQVLKSRFSATTDSVADILRFLRTQQVTTA